MAKLTTTTTYKTRIGSEGAQLQLDYNHETGAVWLEVGVSCDPEDPSILAELDDAKLSDLIDALTQFRELKSSELEKARQGKVGDVTPTPAKPLTFADLGEGDIGCEFRMVNTLGEGNDYYLDKVGTLLDVDTTDKTCCGHMDFGFDTYWMYRDTQIERVV